jgi:chromosome segregation ATPase
MPRIISIAILSIVLFSCQQESETASTDDGNNKELENRIAQLELDNSLKDSVINQSLSFFNEIKSNLEEIGIHKDEIRTISEDPELQSDDKKWILEQIRHINFLREDNARKVKQLNNELSKNGLKIKELEIMVESLMKEIKWKDEQIDMLQAELDVLDKQYSALFDAYQEQSTEIDVLTYKLNAVYYSYGSEDELLENTIIEKKNGFIGIGKKLKLSDDFKSDYFTETSASKTTTFTIRGEDARLITAHPASSYEMVVNGATTKVNILDASEFWKVSKYLVVLVD